MAAELGLLAATAAVGFYGASAQEKRNFGPSAAGMGLQQSLEAERQRANKEAAKAAQLKIDLEELKKKCGELQKKSGDAMAAEDAFRRASPDVLKAAAECVIAKLSIVDKRMQDALQAPAKKTLGRGTLWQLYGLASQVEAAPPQKGGEDGVEEIQTKGFSDVGPADAVVPSRPSRVSAAPKVPSPPPAPATMADLENVSKDEAMVPYKPANPASDVSKDEAMVPYKPGELVTTPSRVSAVPKAPLALGDIEPTGPPAPATIADFEETATDEEDPAPAPASVAALTSVFAPLPTSIRSMGFDAFAATWLDCIAKERAGLPAAREERQADAAAEQQTAQRNNEAATEMSKELITTAEKVLKDAERELPELWRLAQALPPDLRIDADEEKYKFLRVLNLAKDIAESTPVITAKQWEERPKEWKTFEEDVAMARAAYIKRVTPPLTQRLDLSETRSAATAAAPAAVAGPPAPAPEPAAATPVAPSPEAIARAREARLQRNRAANVLEPAAAPADVQKKRPIDYAYDVLPELEASDFSDHYNRLTREEREVVLSEILKRPTDAEKAAYLRELTAKWQTEYSGRYRITLVTNDDMSVEERKEFFAYFEKLEDSERKEIQRIADGKTVDELPPYLRGLLAEWKKEEAVPPPADSGAVDEEGAPATVAPPPEPAPVDPAVAAILTRSKSVGQLAPVATTADAAAAAAAPAADAAAAPAPATAARAPAPALDPQEDPIYKAWFAKLSPAKLKIVEGLSPTEKVRLAKRQVFREKLVATMTPATKANFYKLSTAKRAQVITNLMKQDSKGANEDGQLLALLEDSTPEQEAAIDAEMAALGTTPSRRGSMTGKRTTVKTTLKNLPTEAPRTASTANPSKIENRVNPETGAFASTGANPMYNRRPPSLDRTLPSSPPPAAPVRARIAASDAALAAEFAPATAAPPAPAAAAPPAPAAAGPSSLSYTRGTPKPPPTAAVPKPVPAALPKYPPGSPGARHETAKNYTAARGKPPFLLRGGMRKRTLKKRRGVNKRNVRRTRRSKNRANRTHKNAR